tara:strand:+ start:371 stop:601 length:231 start_codon:yes stop_codon:yes gene_type:complete
MANAKINKEDAPKKEKVIVNTTTLNIREGDLVPTNRGWKKAMCDAHLNNDGIICCTIKTYGEWKWMSYDQSIQVKR